MVRTRPDADGPWDAAVVGGGIVGLSAALELQSRGRRVVVIDPDQPVRRASYGNGGAINRRSILTVAGPSLWRNLFRYLRSQDAGLRIRWGSLPRFARWAPRFLASSRGAAWRRAAGALIHLTTPAYAHHQRLAELVGAHGLLRRSGYLSVYRSEGAYSGSGLEREILAENGVQAVDLTSSDLRDLEPSMADIFAHAILFPESGLVDTPGDLVAAYRRAFVARGGGWIEGTAARLRPMPNHVEIQGPGGPLTAMHAVVSAGSTSIRLLDPLGCRLPLAAERGYSARMPFAQGAALKTPFHDVSAGYAAAPMGGGLRVLSGIELAGEDKRPCLDQLDLATARACEALPLGPPDPSTFWMGSRPSMADGLPAIGWHRRLPRVLVATGHGHIGLSTGPVTGRIVADLITGVSPPFSIEAFAPDRFG